MIYCRYYDLLAAPLLALLLGVGGLAGVTVGDTLPCLQHHALRGGGQRQLALHLLAVGGVKTLGGKDEASLPALCDTSVR